MRPGRRGERGGAAVEHGTRLLPNHRGGSGKKGECEQRQTRSAPRLSRGHGRARPSALQGPPRIPAWKCKAKSFNAWLCRARDVQSKRVISISQAVSPCQRLNSCDEDTTEIFMGKGHAHSQDDAGAGALCSGYTRETAQLFLN